MSCKLCTFQYFAHTCNTLYNSLIWMTCCLFIFIVFSTDIFVFHVIDNFLCMLLDLFSPLFKWSSIMCIHQCTRQIPYMNTHLDIKHVFVTLSPYHQAYIIDIFPSIHCQKALFFFTLVISVFCQTHTHAHVLERA